MILQAKKNEKNLGLYHIHLVRIYDNLIEFAKMLQERIDTWSFECPPPSFSLNIFVNEKSEKVKYSVT